MALKHFIFFRRFNPDADWGGTEVVLMNWFDRIDYEKCKVTLALPKGSTERFLPRLKALKVPVTVVEYDFLPWKTKEREKFNSMRKFLALLKPSKIIFVQ